MLTPGVCERLRILKQCSFAVGNKKVGTMCSWLTVPQQNVLADFCMVRGYSTSVPRICRGTTLRTWWRLSRSLHDQIAWRSLCEAARHLRRTGDCDVECQASWKLLDLRHPIYPIAIIVYVYVCWFLEKWCVKWTNKKIRWWLWHTMD